MNFWNPSYMVSTCSKQWKHELVKYVKYVCKPMYKICSKSTIKAQKQREWYSSDVFMINFRCVSNEDPVEHLHWRYFFAIQWTKAKTFTWVLNTPLKLSTDFTLTTWLWFGTSFIIPFIQIFQRAILKTKFKQFDT